MKQTQIDIHQLITDRVIELLEAGTVPWRISWREAGLPINAVTQKPFLGVNVMLLVSLGYKRNAFLSFRQIKELGGDIKKGEKAQMVTYRKWIPKEGDPEKLISVLRYYYVFNISQCTKLPDLLLPPVPQYIDPLAVCEKIVAEMPDKPNFTDIENEAYYDPGKDIINIPAIEYFLEQEAYYATLFPELVHSTGHGNRLKRKYLYAPTNSPQYHYTLEKLIAEIGGCYLQSAAGIHYNTISDMAGHIQGWQAKLRSDKRTIILASDFAQKATDYILNVKAHVTRHEEHKQLETA